jgi:hypothetical protein
LQVAVVANMFTVRLVPPALVARAHKSGQGQSDEGGDFLFSASMLSVAEAKGWWEPGTPFDFTAHFS